MDSPPSPLPLSVRSILPLPAPMHFLFPHLFCAHFMGHDSRAQRRSQPLPLGEQSYRTSDLVGVGGLKTDIPQKLCKGCRVKLPTRGTVKIPKFCGRTLWMVPHSLNKTRHSAFRGRLRFGLSNDDGAVN